MSLLTLSYSAVFWRIQLDKEREKKWKWQVEWEDLDNTSGQWNVIRIRSMGRYLENIAKKREKEWKWKVEGMLINAIKEYSCRKNGRKKSGSGRWCVNETLAQANMVNEKISGEYRL